MQRKTRRGLGAMGETLAIVGLAGLAVVQGAAVGWGVITGTIEMFRLLLRL